MQRRRSIVHTFEDRISAEKKRLEEQFELLPQGPAKEQLRRKIGQLETASHINEWLTSPGLQAPTRA
jgi:sulfur relay (sulfurtransferase) DsrC/TusE family protein